MTVDREAAAAPSFRPLQAIVALGGIQALTMAAGLARTKVLAHLLGPAGVGVASVIDQVVSLIAQVGSLSIPFVALKFLSRTRDVSRDETRRIYDALFLILLIASMASATIGGVVAFVRPAWFGEGLAPYRVVMLAAVVTVPPFALAPLLRNAMAAFAKHRESAFAAFFGAVLTFVGAYVGVTLGGLAGLYIANALVLVVTVVAMQRYLSGALGLNLSIHVRASAATTTLLNQQGLFGFASAMYVLAFTSPFAYLTARSILLSSHGAIEAGLVAAAYGIAVSVRLVLTQANSLYLTPLLNRNTPKPERIAVVAEYLRVLIVIVAISTLAIVLFPSQWLALLYSSEFLGAVSLVTIFVLAEAILLIVGVYQMLLIGFDDISGHLVATVGGQFVTIALARWLVEPKGGMGVGMAFMMGNVVMLTGTAIRLLQAHDARRVLAPLLPLILALGVAVAAGWWVAGNTPPGVVLRLVAFAVTSGVALLLLRSDERRWLLRPWQGVRPGAAR
jgi:PST family polysaccharide transporter